MTYTHHNHRQTPVEKCKTKFQLSSLCQSRHDCEMYVLVQMYLDCLVNAGWQGYMVAQGNTCFKAIIHI